SVTVKSLSKSTTSPAASDPLPSGSSGADANTLVDKIAETFADILPPAWITRGIRQRIARVEYEAVSDQSRLIPEQRIADIWNEYVREIGASDEALVLPLLLLARTAN